MKWLKAHSVLTCFLIGVLCTFFIVFNFDVIKLNPLNSSVSIEDPTLYYQADSNCAYIVADSGKQIIAVNGDYEYLYSIKGGKRKQDFYYAQEVVTDSKGNLYVHDRLLDENGKNITSERIMKYTGSGEFSAYLHEEPLDNKEKENRNQIYGLTCFDDSLYFIKVDLASFSLCKMDIGNGALTEVKKFSYPDAYRYLTSFTINSNFEVHFTDKYGSVWTAEESGVHRCKYNAKTNGTDDFYSIAASVDYDNDGNIYFNDVGLREIRKIDTKGEWSAYIATGEPMKDRPESFNELPIYSAFSVGGDGTVTIAYSDSYYDEALGEQIYTYNLYAKAADGSIAFNGNTLTKTMSVRIIGWLCCLAILLLALCLGFLIVKGIRRFSFSAISYSAKLQIAVIITAVVIAGIVAPVIINNVNGRYMDELMNKMSNLAVLMARDFNDEDLENINTPSDYQNESYRSIDASVQEVLKSDLNADTGIYCVLYKVQKDIVYAMYSDEGGSGTVNPMEGTFEGSAEQNIYLTGELQKFQTFSSAAGSYMFVLAPVLNDEGKVIALIEMGTDLYAFSSANSALITDTVLKVLMMIITLILLFSESLIIMGVFKEHRRTKQGGLMQDVGIIRPIAFIVFFVGNMSTSFLPVYGKQLWTAAMGIQEEIAVALPISAEVLCVAVASLFGGFLADRIGIKRLSVLGGILFTAGLTLSGVVPTLWLLIGTNALLGIGEGFILISLNTFITGYANGEHRSRGFSNYNAAFLSGMNCGTVIGSLVAEALGYSRVFFVAGAISVIAVLFVIIFLASRSADNTVKVDNKFQKGMSTLKFIFTPRVLTYFLFLFIPYLICASFLNYFFPIFGEQNDLSPSFVAQAFLLSGVIAIYLSPTLARAASKYLGPKRSVITATAIYVAAFLLFAIEPSVLVCFVVIAMLAVADSFGLASQSVYFTSLPEVREYGDGKAMGINSAFENIAQTAGPVVFASMLLLGTERGILLIAECMGALLVLFGVSTFLYKKSVAKEEIVK